ncbi:MAG: asparagine synthase-related protein [Thermoplasmata archaeon]
MQQPSSRVAAEVASRWRDAMLRTVGSSRRISVLYSGGLDSSLVAVGARELAEVELVTVGVRGSHDLLAAEQGARVLGLTWVRRTVYRADIEQVLAAERRALSGVSPVSRAVLVGMALAMQTASQARVLCGQGADELFLGYAHFEGLSSVDLEMKRQADLDRLLQEDWPLSISLGDHVHRKLASPFLEPDFLSYARELSVDQLRAGRGRKPLLRQVAMALGVPPELAERPKKAFQYGSGIERLLRPRSRSG